jgi:hypothetical protein
LSGLRWLTAAAEETDSGLDRGILGERDTERVRVRVGERERTLVGQQTFGALRFVQDLSGSSAIQKITCILLFPLNKLEAVVPYYFDTGPTLLWYHGTVRYHQFGSVYFITVRSE